ncbi:MAG: permease [Pseudomonadota bacterium]
MSTFIARLSRVHLPKLDRVWIAFALILALVAAADTAQFSDTIEFTINALLATLPYILFAVALIGALNATGAATIISSVFEGREIRMIFLAAVFGGLAPFCSCEVIPFIAALLAVGTPLSAVMAFWLASPLIDPPSLIITAGAIGWDFAIAKAVAAVGIGLMGGFVTKWIVGAGALSNPMKPQPNSGCRSCATDPLSGAAVWRFWTDPARVAVFKSAALHNLGFLVKWLAFAYLLESLLIAYIPAETIVGVVGGEGLMPIILAALVGAPAYLNAYAAPPLVAGLIEQGMTIGAAMAFMVAGSVSSIPAMTAVFALVRAQVFALYVILGFVGAVLSGVVFGLI